MIYHSDCRHFRGSRPCEPHKKHGAHCDSCKAYDRVSRRILIIKLDAMGDVLRTTPLIAKLESLYPGCHITWLTRCPEMVPSARVDRILRLSAESIALLQCANFDMAFNLDKDEIAGALLSKVSAREKAGFVLAEDGYIAPIDDRALPKFLTGLFDDVSRANTKSYVEEIFEICGFDYGGELPIVDEKSISAREWPIPAGARLVGLNTGCGPRWRARLWREERWVELAEIISAAGFTPLLLGGPGEEDTNSRISARSGALYLGHFDIPLFMDLVRRCEVIVTQVTMALHLSIALRMKIVLLNTIFNARELGLPPGSALIEPPGGCDCYYADICATGRCCMDEIRASEVLEAIKALSERST